MEHDIMILQKGPRSPHGPGDETDLQKHRDRRQNQDAMPLPPHPDGCRLDAAAGLAAPDQTHPQRSDGDEGQGSDPGERSPRHADPAEDLR